MEGRRWFYRSDDEWIALAERLKLTACPHCRAIGTLIRHGSLTGFDDANPPRKALRARRVFCVLSHALVASMVQFLPNSDPIA